MFKKAELLTSEIFTDLSIIKNLIQIYIINKFNRYKNSR